MLTLEKPYMFRRSAWTLTPALLAIAIAYVTAWLVGCGDDSSAPPEMTGHADATADTGNGEPETGPNVGDASDATDSGDAWSTDATLTEAGDDGSANAEASDDGAIDSGPATGTLGGACYGNNTCNDGFGCDAGVCVPMAAVGALGGACYGNNTCDEGLVCTTGVCAQGPPALTYCDSQAEAGTAARALPYSIAADFTYLDTIGLRPTDLTILSNPDCSDGGTAFPPIPPSALFADASGSADDGGDASSAADDGGADASASVNDSSVDDGAAVDASAEASTGPPACYEFLYNPSCNSVNVCWSGVIFQPTPVEYGAGVCIAPGATMVTFQARSSRANARIKFGAIRAGVGQTEFYINITTGWQSYSVSIPAGEPYNAEPNTAGGVWNGLSVVVEPEDHIGGSYVLVRDIVWTM
jgi:hypothetical protein